MTAFMPHNYHVKKKKWNKNLAQLHKLLIDEILQEGKFSSEIDVSVEAIILAGITIALRKMIMLEKMRAMLRQISEAVRNLNVGIAVKLDQLEKETAKSIGLDW